MAIAVVLAHAFAVLLDETTLASGSFAFGKVPVGATQGTDVRRRGRLAAGTVALVGGGAGGRFGDLEEASFFAGVVDPHQRAVCAAGCHLLPGEEVGVLA